MKKLILKEILKRIESDKYVETLYWGNSKFHNFMHILQSNDTLNEEEISILVDKIINLFRNEEELFYLKIEARVKENNGSKETITIRQSTWDSLLDTLVCTPDSGFKLSDINTERNCDFCKSYKICHIISDELDGK